MAAKSHTAQRNWLPANYFLYSLLIVLPVSGYEIHSIQFRNSKLNMTAEALALKAAYLLGDTMYTAGSTPRNLFAKQQLCDLSVLKELELLINTYKRDPETVDAMLQVQASLKHSQKLKRKTAKIQAAVDDLKRVVHKNWMAVVDSYDAMMDDFGFGVLREMADDDHFGDYTVCNNPEEAYNNSIKASDLFQRLLLPEGEEINEEESDGSPEIFF